MTNRDEAGRGSVEPDQPAVRPSVARLLVVSAVLVLALLTGQSLFAPLVLGWQRAEELLALEDHLATLRQEERHLREDIAYRKTEAGRKLAALETVRVTDPGARLIELVPAEPETDGEAEPTVQARMKAWREEGRTFVYSKWRVLALYALGRRLPPPEPD